MTSYDERDPASSGSSSMFPPPGTQIASRQERGEHTPVSSHDSINSIAGTADGRRFSISAGIISQGRSFAAHWDARDLSRRANVHRSHLSSVIQTGEIGSFGTLRRR